MTIFKTIYSTTTTIYSNLFKHKSHVFVCTINYQINHDSLIKYNLISRSKRETSQSQQYSQQTDRREQSWPAVKLSSLKMVCGDTWLHSIVILLISFVVADGMSDASPYVSQPPQYTAARAPPPPAPRQINTRVGRL